MKGRAWKGQAVIAPWPFQKGVGLGRAISDDPLTLPKRKGKEKASSDNPLALRKEKVQGRVSGNDPLALPEGKILGRRKPPSPSRKDGPGDYAVQHPRKFLELLSTKKKNM